MSKNDTYTVEEIKELLGQLHPDDKKELLAFAACLASRKEGETDE